MVLVDPITTAMSSSPGGSSNGATTTHEKAAAKDGADAPAQPIRTLATPQAQALRHTHPVLLLSLLALRFRALVADPVPTMASALPALAAIQAAYAVVCLPPAGSQGARAKAKARARAAAAAATAARKPRPGEKKKPGGGGAADAAGPNITVTTLVALALSALSAAALHAAFVLLGAPFLTHAPHTLLCALHLALLSLFPLFYARGLDGAAWLGVGVGVLDEASGGLAGACAGAWLGAVPIPLDWDRDWQRWPVTVLCGAYAGYALGKLAGGTVGFGRRFG